jgi:hypothetical protein
MKLLSLLIFAAPIFACSCSINAQHPTVWQVVKLLWGVTFGTCSQ